MPDTNDEFGGFGSMALQGASVRSEAGRQAGVKGLRWLEVARQGEIYTPRFSHAAVELNGQVYVFGGDTGNFYTKTKLLNDLYAFNADSKVWSRLKPQDTGSPVPCPRCGHTLVAYNGQLVLFGGTSTDSESLGDVWVFDPVDCKWEEVKNITGCRPSPRLYHTAITYSNAMYIFGGVDGDEDIWRFDLVAKTWQKMPVQEEPMLAVGSRPASRWLHTAAVWHDDMYIYGGESEKGSTFGDLWRWSFLTHRWTKLEAPTVKGTPPCSRAFHASVTLKNKWLIHAGRDGTQKLGDAFEYHFEKQEWRPVTTHLAPWCQAARWGHRIVFISKTKSFVVCGGVTTEVLVLL